MESVSQFWVYIQELKAMSQRHVYVYVFTAAWFTAVRMWKQLCVRQWMNGETGSGVCCMHTMEYYSALKEETLRLNITQP